MRFHPSKMKTLLAELQTQYEVVDLDNIADGVVAGQGMMCVGQPSRGDGVWTYGSAALGSWTKQCRARWVDCSLGDGDTMDEHRWPACQ